MLGFRPVNPVTLSIKRAITSGGSNSASRATALVAMLSRSVALLPGDLVFIDTPVGVGQLAPGDVVTGGVAGVGEFSMTVGGVPERATIDS